VISYARKAIPEPYTILGLRLKPFSLGHYILLDRYEVNFASREYHNLFTATDNPKRPITGFEDFLLAVCICSMTYEEFTTFINDGDAFFKYFRDWGTAVHKQIKKDKDFDLLYRINLFKKYMKEGTEVPSYWEEDAKGSSSGGHWIQAVLLTLTSECGYTQTEALNCPFSKALYDYLKVCERNGALTLYTEEELASEEQVKKAQGGSV
jgi:hypothetical protein